MKILIILCFYILLVPSCNNSLRSGKNTSGSHMHYGLPVLSNVSGFGLDTGGGGGGKIIIVKNLNRDGEGKMIQHENDVGGYPVIPPVYRTFNLDDWDLNTLTQLKNY